MKAARLEVPKKIAVRLRRICLALPQAYEETAWTGVRWKIRQKTFAHSLIINEGWPPAYAKAAATRGPACIVTFRSRLPEVDAEVFRQFPFFKPIWWPDIVGTFIDEHTDWKHIEALLKESYRMLAPQKLADTVT